MSKEEFDSTLRRLMERRPFSPFIVHLMDGRRINVKEPPIAFSDGAASFIDPDDGALVDFSHEEISSFGIREQEVSV